MERERARERWRDRVCVRERERESVWEREKSHSTCLVEIVMLRTHVCHYNFHPQTYFIYCWWTWKSWTSVGIPYCKNIIS